MATAPRTVPVRESITRIHGELAVGEDLKFQERWWKFERGVWTVFAFLLVLDAAGAFGRGPLAKAQLQGADGGLQIKYERVERMGTPSTMTIRFGPPAIRNGQAQLWVSDSVVKQLGMMRLVPEPMNATLADEGVLYTFATNPHSDTVALQLQPKSPGAFHFTMHATGAQQVAARVIVVP